jgi:hypothetical protein
MHSIADQQNMSHRSVKPGRHPDRRSRLCWKSTGRNLFAGRGVIGPMHHRRRPVNNIVSPAVLPDRHAADASGRHGTSVGGWHIN